MVSAGTIITGSIIAAVLGFTIYFRRELGEAGTQIGGGLGALGKGLQQFGAGAGGGIGQFISGAFSPKIRPEFVPTVGFKLELPSAVGEVPSGCYVKPLFEDCREGYYQQQSGLHAICCPEGNIGGGGAPDDRQGGRGGGIPPRVGGRIGEARCPGGICGTMQAGTDRQGTRTE